MGEACQFVATSIPSITPVHESLSRAQSLHSWHALKVRVGSETAVVNALETRGFTSYCPTQQERRRYSDRMKVVEKPLFPGYVFCSFDIAKKLPVVSCPGVDYIVGCAGVPAPIPEAQIEGIRRMVQAGAVASERFAAGDRVRVMHGPLQGIEGILVREPRGQRLVVSVELLNRGASLLIDQDWAITVPLDKAIR
jgi:transcription antitermination factor NusG